MTSDALERLQRYALPYFRCMGEREKPGPRRQVSVGSAIFAYHHRARQPGHALSSYSL
jgi:hypothetical protein